MDRHFRHRRPSDVSERHQYDAWLHRGRRGASDAAVDIKIALTRSRDGHHTEEGMTIGYDAGFKPICAFILDGSYWLWNLSEPLPAAALTPRPFGVQFTGDIFRTPDALTSDSNFTGMVSLDPDTADSAYLTFTYNLPVPIVSPGSQQIPLQMLGEQTAMRFRITPSGNLIGFQYLRTGLLAGSPERVTLRMNSN